MLEEYLEMFFVMANVEGHIMVAVEEGERRRITLDLEDTTLTGQDGINFLGQWEAADIALVNCVHMFASGSRDKDSERSRRWLSQESTAQISHFIKE